MKKVIKWVLAAFVGVVASFILVLVSEGLHMIVTCGIVALSVGAILYYTVLERVDFRLLVSIAAGIVSFFLYLLLYSHVNESADSSTFFAYLVFFVPYIFFAYVLFGTPNDQSSE